jgi:hypothetical protein
MSRNIIFVLVYHCHKLLDFMIRKKSNTDLQNPILIQMSTECGKYFTDIDDPY